MLACSVTVVRFPHVNQRKNVCDGAQNARALRESWNKDRQLLRHGAICVTILVLESGLVDQHQLLWHLWERDDLLDFRKSDALFLIWAFRAEATRRTIRAFDPLWYIFEDLDALAGKHKEPAVDPLIL